MARPREFEPEEALEAIKDTFWRLGYEGASMQEIEAATGLKKQSLYRLFGDKRGMYLAAVEHYGRHEVAEAAQLLQAPGDARQRIERLFGAMIDAAVKTGDRRGCFLCNASVDQAPTDEATRRLVELMMTDMRGAIEDALRVSPPYDRNAKLREARAAHLMAAYFGLRVMIRAGVSPALLKTTAKEAVGSV